MSRSVIISSVLHAVFILLTAMSFPFLTKKPIDLPPIVSIELIQITDKTNIPFAPKAKKIFVNIDKDQLNHLNLRADLKIHADLRLSLIHI